MPLPSRTLVVGRRALRRCGRSGVARELVFGALYLVAAIVLTFSFVRPPAGLGSNSRAPFGQMVDGTAHLPFANRALVPALVRAIDGAVSEEARARLDATLHDEHVVVRTLDQVAPAWTRERLVQYLACLGILYASLVGFLYALRYLWTGAVKAPPFTGAMVPLLAVAALPPFFDTYASYMYDFPALLLFTLGLGLLVRRRFVPFLLLYAVGCLNKETTVLLTLVFALYFLVRNDLGRRRFALLLVAQVAIFVGVKLGLALRFSDNPGGVVEFRLFRNLVRLPRYPLGSLYGGLALVAVFVWQWRRIPLFLRCAIVPLAPLIVLTFFLGYFDEIRDYYEALPALLLALAFLLCRLAGLEVRDANDDRRPLPAHSESDREPISGSSV